MYYQAVNSRDKNEYKIKVPFDRNDKESFQIFDKGLKIYKPVNLDKDILNDIYFDDSTNSLTIFTPDPNFVFWVDSEGNSYQGALKNGEFHGEGRLSRKDGIIEKGNFVSGKLNGEGCLATPEGYTYEGEMKDSIEHGKGKLTLEDGTSYTGKFDDGNVVNHNLLKNLKKRKDQTVLLINHLSSYRDGNVNRLSQRYKNVKHLDENGTMNADFMKSLITLPTKGTNEEKKLKFSILEHGNLNGGLVNESFHLKALQDTLKEVVRYNDSHSENKIMKIDISLDCCNGNEVF